MIRRRAFLGAGLAAAAAATGLAPFPRVAVARAEGFSPALITKAREGLKTVTARFAQTRTVGLLAADVNSKGAMTIVRPDRLRWDLEPPDAVTYWIGPEGIAYR